MCQTCKKIYFTSFTIWYFFKFRDIILNNIINIDGSAIFIHICATRNLILNYILSIYWSLKCANTDTDIPVDHKKLKQRISTSYEEAISPLIPSGNIKLRVIVHDIFPLRFIVRHASL